LGYAILSSVGLKVILPQAEDIKCFATMLGVALPYFTQNRGIDTHAGDNHLTLAQSRQFL
jgi:ribosomal protein L5